jgi:cation diffusion facilitator family transporter
MSESEASRARAVRRVLLLTMGLNLLVALGKIAYGHFSNALSVRADGFHSLTDATNNVVGIVAVRLAGRPADEGHPYGHAKFELLAAGLVGLSLLGMAYDVLRGAVEGLLHPGVLPNLDGRVFVVLVVTLAINMWVASYEKRMGEKLDSPFLSSDAAHTRSDILVTLGVVLTMALVEMGYSKLDGVAAIVIGGFIGWAGIDVLRSNLRHLADARAIEPALVEKIVCQVAGVASTHKIRTRGAPGSIHVDLHVQIAPHLDVVTAHRVTHWVIEAIKREFPGVKDVLVHTEPAAEGQKYNPLP